MENRSLRKFLTRQEKSRRQKQLVQAKEVYDAYPDSLEAIIWYGRRLAYLGLYNEAIAVYTSGLNKYPESYKLLRHRGHRLITIRDFASAQNDLEKAAFYSRNVANEIEQDGIPNRLNKPLRNIKFNIWYHLGLSYYLQRNYDKALSAYKKCLEVSDNDDLFVATTTWLYRTYVKIGNTEKAMAVLDPISSNMRIIENENRQYYNLLKLFKGKMTPNRIAFLAKQENNTLEPTAGYGLGNWYVLQGDLETANEVFDQVISGNSWDHFGYIASEIEKSNIEIAPL